MQYCPECGKELTFGGVETDVPTDHYLYHCAQSHKWSETVDKSGNLVHITQVSEEQTVRINRYTLMLRLSYYAAIYLVFCLIGAGLEWAYGTLWNTVGTAPWIYPNSPIHFTSLEVAPIWGFGAIACISINRALIERSTRPLLAAVVSLICAAVVVVSFGIVCGLC